MGVGYGLNYGLNYVENIGTSTRPEFVKRTGNANPFDAIYDETAALADLDGDGTLSPRPSINKLRPQVFCLSQVTWTS